MLTFTLEFLHLRATAAKYYEQSGNNARAYHCYVLIEDYRALEKLSRALQDNNPLLQVRIALTPSSSSSIRRPSEIRSPVLAYPSKPWTHSNE